MRPTPDQIIDAVSVVSGVPRDCIVRTSSRTSTHVEAAASAVVLMRQLCGMSYPECARALKRKSHSSIAAIEYRANYDWTTLAKRELEDDDAIPEPNGLTAWTRLERRVGRKGALLVAQELLTRALKEGVPA